MYSIIMVHHRVFLIVSYIPVTVLGIRSYRSGLRSGVGPIRWEFVVLLGRQTTGNASTSLSQLCPISVCASTLGLITVLVSDRNLN